MSESGRILICGTNWLGDSVMSMPAVQRFKQRHPACRVTMLVKRGLAPLWRLHPHVTGTGAFDACAAGTVAVSRELRGMALDAAYVFPNSFRSALIPFLARVRRRVGVRGQWRYGLLTDLVSLADELQGTHQSAEYLAILGMDPEDAVPAPRLGVPDALRVRAAEKAGMDPAAAQALVAVIPGAARGAAKRWPQEHFVATGRWLVGSGRRVVVLGSEAEAALCGAVAAGIGAGAVNLAGGTDIPELAAILSLCRAAVTNDSGGMHLAAAAGCRVVAIFGMTDPVKTGPLGAGHHIVSSAGTPQSRDIPRNSRAAEACLRGIVPETVIEALRQVLAGDRTP